MLVFYFFAALVIWLGVLSLRSGIQYYTYVKAETAKRPAGFTPFVSVIAPCRGDDQGLGENIAPLFLQHYPAYELIFVTDQADDTSLPTIRKHIEQNAAAPVAARTIIAGEAVDCGQKVHNLTVAV